MLFLKINFEIQIWLYKLSANVSSDMRLDLFRDSKIEKRPFGYTLTPSLG